VLHQPFEAIFGNISTKISKVAEERRIGNLFVR